MNPSQLDMLLCESGMDSDVASDLATLLAPLADPTEIPTPSADLLALFGQGPCVEPVPGRVVSTGPRRRPGRKRGALAGAVVLAISGVGATGLSAAANTLPSPWQSQVSDFSQHYLPFHFPQPRTRFAQGRGALGAEDDHTRTAGKHRPAEERPAVSDGTEGPRSLSGDREVSHKRLSRSGQPRTRRPATTSTPVPRGPRTATASPSAAPAFMVKSAPALHSEGEPRGSWQGSSHGSSQGFSEGFGSGSNPPSKTPSKAPFKAPFKAPSKAPSKAPATPPTKDVDHGQKPDKGHDPVVGGPKGPQKGPAGGPSSGSEPDPSDDPSVTPGAGGDHQDDGSSESPPADQADPSSHGGAGQDTGDQPVHDPVGGQTDRGVLPEATPTLDRVVAEAAVALGGH